MKVKDLIEKLETVNPEADVHICILADTVTYPVGDFLTAAEKDEDGNFVFVDERAFSAMKDEIAILLESE